MSVEVIIVDDNKNTAETYAALVQSQCRMNAVAADDPDKALQIVREHSVKVAVLDQRMPKMSGIQLFGEMRKIDPNILGLMVTGEADANEVGEGYEVGLSGYLHKSEIQSLPVRILFHLAQYHAKSATISEGQNSPFYSYRSAKVWPLSSHEVKLFFIGSERIETEVVLANEWQTIARVNAGEIQKKTIRAQHSRKLVIDTTETAKLASSLGLKSTLVQGLEAKVNAELTGTTNETATSESLSEETMERTFSLQADPSDPTQEHPIAREILHAPVYERVRLAIRRECTCCASSEVIIVTGLRSTRQIATKQIDYLSSGKKREIDTGSIRL